MQNKLNAWELSLVAKTLDQDVQKIFITTSNNTYQTNSLILQTLWRMLFSGETHICCCFPKLKFTFRNNMGKNVPPTNK